MGSELGGVDNPYRAPEADHDVVSVAGSSTPYVVSTTKLAVLYVATLGIYNAYWAYKHWRHQKLLQGSPIWPLARAIFGIFYVVPLFRAIEGDARRSGHTTSFNPGAQGALFITVMVLTRIFDKMADASEELSVFSVISLGTSLVGIVPLAAAQKVVNLDAGDPDGSSNSGFGAGEIILLLLGLALWGLTVRGVIVTWAR